MPATQWILLAVVSGLARGVDGAAHRGALDGPGGTLAVLGCGVDVVYPVEHARLAAQVAGAGALVSECGPGVPPRRHHFPRRNRIISGLSLAVVIVEAAVGSGSLITARLAAEQGREVLVVPGNVLTGRNRGGHALIKDGAKPVESAVDILEEIGPGLATADPPGPGSGAAPADPVAAVMDRGETYDLDTLASLSGLDSARLLARLADLELEGHVFRAAGGRFGRLG